MFETIAPALISPEGDFVYSNSSSKYAFSFDRTTNSYRPRGLQFTAPSWSLADVEILEEFKVKLIDLGS